MRSSIIGRYAFAAGIISLCAFGRPLSVTAQPKEPLGRFVVDLRGSFVPFKRSDTLAALHGFTGPETPGPGLGIDAGAHLYFLRWHNLTFGLGASLHSSFADQNPGELSPNPDGPPVRKRFTAISSQLSLNIGGRNGWSYISGGIGSSRLSIYSQERNFQEAQSANTINYGGGARWFDREHVAFSLDLRFYTTRAPQVSIMVVSIGASFK